MEKITKNKLHDLGFSSHFTTDPQELNASIAYVKNNITIHQPNENIDDFIIEVDGEFVDVEYVEDLINTKNQ